MVNATHILIQVLSVFMAWISALKQMTVDHGLLCVCTSIQHSEILHLP
jgi:hypothetical protein